MDEVEAFAVSENPTKALFTTITDSGLVVVREPHIDTKFIEKVDSGGEFYRFYAWDYYYNLICKIDAASGFGMKRHELDTDYFNNTVNYANVNELDELIDKYRMKGLYVRGSLAEDPVEFFSTGLPNIDDDNLYFIVQEDTNLPLRLKQVIGFWKELSLTTCFCADEFRLVNHRTEQEMLESPRMVPGDLYELFFD